MSRLSAPPESPTSPTSPTKARATSPLAPLANGHPAHALSPPPEDPRSPRAVVEDGDADGNDADGEHENEDDVEEGEGVNVDGLKESKGSKGGDAKGEKKTEGVEEGKGDEESEEVEEDPATQALEIVDMDTFAQILELDEDEGAREFSTEMVWQYFAQAGEKIKEMESVYLAASTPPAAPSATPEEAEKHAVAELLKLSNLGHFLKGSSAALGVARVQASCEQIQHYGKLWDEAAGASISCARALAAIRPLLRRVKRDYRDAEGWLRGWYKERGVFGPVDG